MKRGFSDWPCSVARAADIFGDSWTMLIIRDCMHGLTRFDDFQRSLHIARNTLSDRLNKLVDAGVLTKQFYQDNPPRYEYLLTDMGRELFSVVTAMLAWGDKWLDSGAGAPVTLHHEACGHDLAAQVVCAHCGEQVFDYDVQFCVGPGYPAKEPTQGDIRSRLAAAPGAEGGRPHAHAAPTAAVARRTRRASTNTKSTRKRASRTAVRAASKEPTKSRAS